jgi:hypothetical protein
MLNFPLMFQLHVDFAQGGLDLGVAKKAVERMFCANPEAQKIMFTLSCRNEADNAKLDEAIGKLRKDLQNPENAKITVEVEGASRSVVMSFDSAFLEAELLN